MKTIARRDDYAAISIVGSLAAIARTKHGARHHFASFHGNRPATSSDEDLREAASILAGHPHAPTWDNALDESRYLTPVQLARSVVKGGLPGRLLLALGWDRPDGGGDVYIETTEGSVEPTWEDGFDPVFDVWFRSWFGNYAFDAEGRVVAHPVQIEPSRRRETLLAIAAAVPGSVVVADFGRPRRCYYLTGLRTAFSATVRGGVLVVEDLRSSPTRWLDDVLGEAAGVVRPRRAA